MTGPINDMVALENALTSVVKDHHDRDLDAGLLPQEMYDTALATSTGKIAINPSQPAIVVTVSAESLLGLSDKPARVVDGDHVKEWADGGATNITNAQPLCSLHHSMKTARNNHRRAA
jgi:predicted restriction endonuclease